MVEFIDVLNESGNKIGEIAAREQVHNQGLWHKTVHVWWIDGAGRILLQLRSKYCRSNPLTWDIAAGGHVRAGETSVQAARREIFEELGYVSSDDQLYPLYQTTYRMRGSQIRYFDNVHCDLYLIVQKLPASTFVLQKREVDQVRWVSLSTFQERITRKDETVSPYVRQDYEALPPHLLDKIGFARGASR